MFDRRQNGWVRNKVYLFIAKYDDGLPIEIQDGPEFGSTETARKVATKYADVTGRLTTSSRKDLETVWIHKGINPFGGGNDSRLIHTGRPPDMPEMVFSKRPWHIKQHIHPWTRIMQGQQNGEQHKRQTVGSCPVAPKTIPAEWISRKVISPIWQVAIAGTGFRNL